VNQFQARLEYCSYLAIAGVARGLPEAAARRLARAIAQLLFAYGGQRQGAALANLRLAYPNLSDRERRAIARESWVQTAWAMLDAVRSRAWSDEELGRRVRFENLEVYPRAERLSEMTRARLTRDVERFDEAVRVRNNRLIELAELLMRRYVLNERTSCEGADRVDRNSAAPR